MLKESVAEAQFGQSVFVATTAIVRLKPGPSLVLAYVTMRSAFCKGKSATFAPVSVRTPVAASKWDSINGNEEGEESTSVSPDWAAAPKLMVTRSIRPILPPVVV